MVKLLYILGTCAMLAAGGVFGLWWCERGKVDREIEEFLNRPGAVERFRAQGSGSESRPAEVSALVVQAEAYARLLDPPRKAETLPAPAPASSPALAVPVVRPAAPSAVFRLDGISYHRSRPEESMALVWEPAGGRRWLRQGDRLGHFVVHEIHADKIVYRAGGNLREMAVEHGASPPGIVRDTRPGSRRVSSAPDDAAAALAGSVGLDSVESVGAN